MADVQITIDQRRVTVPEGITILAAAARAGIRIPFLCWSPLEETEGKCGLCGVEVGGIDRLLPACTTSVREGMEILTNSEPVREMRRDLVDVFFEGDSHDCENCHRSGECSVQRFLQRHHLNKPTVEEIYQALDIQRSKPLST